MTDKDFDGKVRELCSGFGETPPSDIWNRIEKGLDSRRRVVILRRVVIAAASAAAVVLCLLVMPEAGDAVDVKPAASVQAQVAETGSLMQLQQAEQVPAVESVVRHGPDAGAVSVCQVPSVSDTSAVGEQVRVVAMEQASPGESGMPAADVSENPASAVSEVSVSEGYSISDYLASADSDAGGSSRISLSAASDFYTIYGNGNVNFTSRSMSGGGSSSGSMPSVKPLSGESPRHDFPVSAGLSLQYGFGSTGSGGQHRFGVGIGVNYTYLKSSYEALVTKEYLGKYGQGSEQASVVQSMHYIGIPVSFFYNILATDKLFFYVSAGGAMEKGLSLKYRFTGRDGAVSSKSLSVSGVQWSADVGLGFEYRFVSFMGVYIDPRLTYFFDCQQPYSIREEQRLQMNLGLGFRFHF